jgi:hypothetical protein
LDPIMHRIDSPTPAARRPLVGLAFLVLVGVIAVRDAARPPAASSDPAAGGHARSMARAVGPALASESADGAADQATAAAGDAGRLRLEGVVFRGDELVAGARVVLDGGRSVVTEGDGSFVFVDLAEGSYDVMAEDGDGFAEVQQVALDERSEPVSLRLVRGPTLIVHVVDDRARPLAGVTVVVGGRSAATTSAGTARFRAVDVELEFVDVRAPDRAHVHQRVDTGEDPTATIDCTVVLVAGSDLSGTVVDEAGRPVPEAYVQLDPTVDGASGETVFADATGAWQMHNVGTSTYTLQASSRAHIATAELALAHDGTRATRGIVVRVEAGGEIAGLVVDAAGRPVEGARVRAGPVAETSDARGEFVLRGLAPEIYSVSAATTTLGAIEQQVALARGQRVRLRFEVAASGLAGVVVDQAGERIEAFVFAKSEALNSFIIERTDLYGHFDFGGLPPGRYVVSAQLRSSRNEGPAVEVTTGSRNLTLVVPARARVTGRVILDGVPVRHYRFAITDDPAADPRTTAVYDASGRFAEPDAPPGTFAVLITGPGLANRVVEHVAITPGRTTDLGDIAVTRAPGP